jgi:hypothetical protein
MNGWDFSILWAAGHAVLVGSDPYKVPFFYYPLPFAYILALLAILPEHISFAMWICTNLVLMVATLRKQFWQWLLYLPILHMLSSGQVEFLWWAMARGLGRDWQGAILGAIITLKPQAALLFLPWHILDWLRHDRRTLLRWASLTVIIWVTPMLWRPQWIFDWMKVVPPDPVVSASSSPGIFSLLKISTAFLIPAAIVAICVFIWGMRQNEQVARASVMLAAPVGSYYSTMALLDCAPAWLLVPTSLLATVLALWLQNITPFMLLPLAVFGWHFYLAKHRDKSEIVMDQANSGR